MKKLTNRTSSELDLMYGDRSKWENIYIAYDEQKNDIEMLEIIKNNPMDSIFMLKNQDENLCKLAIKLSPASVKYVKNPTEEMYMDAIKYSNGEYYSYIPKEHRTIAIDLAAIKCNIKNISKVNPSVLTESLCIKALKQFGYYIITDIPDTLHTEKVCLEAVSQCGIALLWCKCRSKKIKEVAISDSPITVTCLQDGEYDDSDLLLALSKDESLLVPISHMFSKLKLPEDYMYPENIMHYLCGVDEKIINIYSHHSNKQLFDGIAKSLQNIFNK